MDKIMTERKKLHKRENFQKNEEKIVFVFQKQIQLRTNIHLKLLCELFERKPRWRFTARPTSED